MKKLIAIILLLNLVLTSCTTPDADTTTSCGSDLQQGVPSEEQISQTDLTDNLEGTNSGPGPSATTSTNPSVPDPSETGTKGTEGTKPTGSTEGTDQTEPTQPQATEKPTTSTAPPEGTKPTNPLETTPTQPPETQPPATTPEETEHPTTEIVVLDFDAAEAYGNAYGVNTYQWVVDPSLTMSNAGFNFPDTISIAGLQENGGQEYLNRIVKEGVDALYTTLSLYGSPKGCRINCHIELLDSDTVAIYILYG